ncbi:MAG: acetyltransferase [Gemmatimonadota bacterium]
MITLEPVTLELNGVRLEPMTGAHAPEIAEAAADGRLWELFYTTVPAPENAAKYVATALEGQQAGHMLPWVVRDLESGAVIGSTRYHDVVPALDRVEIGYTFYASRFQRTHVNTTCKVMLLRHAFDTVGCRVVGLRTDNFNFRSQQAIAALGAKRDGVLRHHALRKDGSVRDTVMFSILAAEWPDVERNLLLRLARHRGTP